MRQIAAADACEVESVASRMPLRRRGKDAQRGARHDAEGAFAADEKLL
jgi:hypothetical protein